MHQLPQLDMNRVDVPFESLVTGSNVVRLEEGENEVQRVLSNSELVVVDVADRIEQRELLCSSVLVFESH